MKANIALPNCGKMTPQQVSRYRALLAFQLRATGMDHHDISRVLNLNSAFIARRCVKLGRKRLLDCVIGTVSD